MKSVPAPHVASGPTPEGEPQGATTNAINIEPAKSAARHKSPRRRAREFALQGLYAWQMNHGSAAEIEAGFAMDKGLNNAGFDKADRKMFSSLLSGTIREAAALEVEMQPALDRQFSELSPVERAVLLLGAFELKHVVETPYRVIINEAIELAKSFGGTDGHKYVNGVLDKLVRTLRPYEFPEIS